MFRGQRPSPHRQDSASQPPMFVVGGVLQSITDVILQPVIILAAIAFLIGGSNTQIATFAVASVVAWSLAPLLVTGVRAFSAHLAALAWLALLVRLVAVGAIALVGLNLDTWSMNRVLATLVPAYIAYQAGNALAGQASAPAAMSLLARTRRLGLLRWRHLGTIVVSLLTAWLVARVLTAETSLQDSLQGLLVLAALATIGASWFLGRVLFGRRTTSSTVHAPRLATDMRRALGNPAIRRFLGFRFLLAAVAAFDPFLVVLGFQHLGLEVRYIGWMLVAWAAGQAIGSFAWPRWISRHGARIPFQLATFFRLLLLVWVVALPTLVESSAYTDRFDGPTAAMRGFAASFVLLGLAGSAGSAGNVAYLTRTSPTRAISGAMLTVNLAAAIGGLLPFAVAWALDRYDDQRVFWVAIGVAVVALLASGLLADTGTRIRRRSGSWRHESSTRTA